MKLYLIRHGKTEGNLLGRYIGKTDESLSEEGVRSLLESSLWRKESGMPEALYTSTRRRTKETAELIFPQVPIRERRGLDECDFGEFENKNYRELSGNKNYQSWVDSGGKLPFPGGESREGFTERTIKAFLLAVEEAIEEKSSFTAFVIHGGSIMSIMEKFAFPAGEFYEWQVKNGQGFLAEIDEKAWMSGDRKLMKIRRIP